MATFEVCDICGDPIIYGQNKKEYKIKKRKYNFYSSTNPWIEFSAHESCIRALLAARDNQITNEMIMEEIRKKIITEVGNDK